MSRGTQKTHKEREENIMKITRKIIGETQVRNLKVNEFQYGDSEFRSYIACAEDGSYPELFTMKMIAEEIGAEPDDGDEKNLRIRLYAIAKIDVAFVNGEIVNVATTTEEYGGRTYFVEL